jgi:hypothetical protein
MKTKAAQRIERINKSKSWTERMMLARDHLPGTQFDRTIIAWMDTLNSMETNGHRQAKRVSYFSKESGHIDLAAMNHDSMAAMGEYFATAFKEGESNFFREWADAVDKWHNHRPYEDKLRSALIKFCVPPNEKFQMRDIIQHLRETGFKEVTGDGNRKGQNRDLNNIRRKIYGICEELGISIQGERGRPRNIRKEPSKKRKLKS